jgi:hypothetical protein
VILKEPNALISLNLAFVMCRWCAKREPDYESGGQEFESPGAPLRYKTGNAKTRRFCAWPRTSRLLSCRRSAGGLRPAVFRQTTIRQIPIKRPQERASGGRWVGSLQTERRRGGNKEYANWRNRRTIK